MAASESPARNPERSAAKSKDLLRENSRAVWSEATGFKSTIGGEAGLRAELEATWQRLSRQPKS